MSIYLDTSALAKLYHLEIGSTFVEEFLSQDQPVFLSRLGVLEMHSVLCGKVRTKMLTEADADLIRRRFRSEVRNRRFRIAGLRVRHYELAETLVAEHGSTLGLRTLDSLQLAVALDLARNGFVQTLVTADKVLVKVALMERLNCIDPEVAGMGT